MGSDAQSAKHSDVRHDVEFINVHEVCDSTMDPVGHDCVLQTSVVILGHVVADMYHPVPHGFEHVVNCP